MWVKGGRTGTLASLLLTTLPGQALSWRDKSVAITVWFEYSLSEVLHLGHIMYAIERDAHGKNKGINHSGRPNMKKTVTGIRKVLCCRLWRTD